MANINLCFVSHKISKVKWQLTPADVRNTDIFASGSWDNEINKLSLWKVSLSPSLTPNNINEAAECEPQLLCDASVTGDVMGLQFIDPENIVIATSAGSAALYRYHPSQSLSLTRTWPNLHFSLGSNVPSTSVAVCGQDTFATSGEDGRINILNPEHIKPITVLENVDSSTINDILFLRNNELLLVSSSGQLKFVDVRADTNASKIYCLSGEDRSGFQCVAKHPTQSHITATGSEDGTLCIWDLRQEKFPVNTLEAHGSIVWEIKFHPSSPDNLFTCSEDGTVWHWDGTSVSASGTNYGETERMSSYTSLWLQAEVSQQRLEVTEVIKTEGMPINTLDIQSNVLICGSDNEALYTLRDMVVK